MTIFYKLFSKLYVNITNACPCSCVFCLRQSGDGVGDAKNLWLEHEPDIAEIKEAFNRCDLGDVDEIVFCGYGEPMERADIVIEICKYIKTKCDLPLRINTNGLAKLINPEFEMSNLSVIESVSVSLNACNEEEYQRITCSCFGESSFQAMKNFALEAKKYTSVCFTAVDIISEEQIERCRTLAAGMGIPFRVRAFVGNNESYS